MRLVGCIAELGVVVLELEDGSIFLMEVDVLDELDDCGDCVV